MVNSSSAVTGLYVLSTNQESRQSLAVYTRAGEVRFRRILNQRTDADTATPTNRSKANEVSKAAQLAQIN
jgi:phage protein U